MPEEKLPTDPDAMRPIDELVDWSEVIKASETK